MSWNDWAAQVTANGANSECMIVALDGTSAWGATNCGLFKYDLNINDGEGGKKKVTIDEGKRIASIMKSNGKPSKDMRDNGGLYINKKSYRAVRYLEDIKALYLKGPG